MTQVQANKSHNKGFTLIELMLAMSFISVLLLSIAMTAIQAGRMYNRGTVLRSVNQAVRDTGDILRRDFLQTNATKIITSPDGTPVISIAEGEANSGRFCLGQYSYLWNSPKVLDDELLRNDMSNGAIVRDNSASKNPISFVRVDDPDGALCKPTGGKYTATISLTDATQLLKPIASDDVSLAVYEMTVTPVVSSDTSDGLYRIQLKLGTSAINEIDSSGCKPPNDSKANADFCAINKIDIIVRTNG